MWHLFGSLEAVHRWFLVVGLLVAGLSCAGLPGGEIDGAVAAPSGELLYVCNQDDASVTVLHLETQRVVRTIDLQELGFSAQARPHDVAVEPGGAHWYVSLIGEGKVVKLDRNDRVVGTAEFETPGMLALDHERDRLFVGRSMTAVNPPRRIGLIRTSDMTIEEIEIFHPQPHAMVVDERTGIAYTASLGVNQIAAVDPATERAVLTDVDGPPHALMQFTLSPDGRTLAISGEISHTVLFFDISGDPLRPRHLADVEVAPRPFDPIFTLDGRTLWVGNKTANTITAIDLDTYEVVTVLDDARIRQPHGSAVSPDGRWVLISNSNVREYHDMPMGDYDEQRQAEHAAEHDARARGSVALIDAGTHELVRVIEVGHNATGIAVAR